MPKGVYNHKKNFIMTDARIEHIKKVGFQKGNKFTGWNRGKKIPIETILNGYGNFKHGKYFNYRFEKLKAGKPPKRCQICRTDKIKIVFDHNHKTGKFRGWICNNCNTAIGLTKENVKILKQIIKYIIKHNGNTN